MRIRIKNVLGTAAILAGVLAVTGVASARWPALGVEWADWTRYDANGDAIGGGRIECDGSVQTWGEAGGPTGLILHSCN